MNFSTHFHEFSMRTVFSESKPNKLQYCNRNNKTVTEKQPDLLDIYWTGHDTVHGRRSEWDFSAVTAKGRELYDRGFYNGKALSAVNQNNTHHTHKNLRRIIQYEKHEKIDSTVCPPRYTGNHPKRKQLLRLGCAALALTLAMAPAS